MATSPVGTVRRLPRAALSRLKRALENTLAGAAPLAAPVEEMLEVQGGLGEGAHSGRWGPSPRTLPGVDLQLSRQLELLEQMRRSSTNLPAFQTGSALPWPEVIGLHVMLRVLQPRRVVELGAAEARAVLRQWIEPGSAPLSLDPGDLLYAGVSELPELLFEVLPSLPAGVFVQLREVLYPFRGVPLLRAFLQYNRDFQIRFWPSYLYQHARDRLAAFPQICADSGGIWIRKVG